MSQTVQRANAHLVKQGRDSQQERPCISGAPLEVQARRRAPTRAKRQDETPLDSGAVSRLLAQTRPGSATTVDRRTPTRASPGTVVKSSSIVDKHGVQSLPSSALLGTGTPTRHNSPGGVCASSSRKKDVRAAVGWPMPVELDSRTAACVARGCAKGELPSDPSLLPRPIPPTWTGAPFLVLRVVACQP